MSIVEPEFEIPGPTALIQRKTERPDAFDRSGHFYRIHTSSSKPWGEDFLEFVESEIGLQNRSDQPIERNIKQVSWADFVEPGVWLAVFCSTVWAFLAGPSAYEFPLTSTALIIGSLGLGINSFTKARSQ